MAKLVRCCAYLCQAIALVILSSAVYALVFHPTSIEQFVLARVARPELPPVYARPTTTTVEPVTASQPPPPPPPPPPRPRANLTAAAATLATAARPPANVSWSTRSWAFPVRRVKRRSRANDASLPTCASLGGWDDSHFSADRDWVPSTDGHRLEPSTRWKWSGAPTSSKVAHLYNEASRGHLNSRPGGFVRGHGNADRTPRRAAEAGKSTELRRETVDYDRFRTPPAPCVPSTTIAMRFTAAGGGYVHVTDDGSVSATMTECSDDPACLFAVEAAPGGWFSLRSRLTGGLLRMVGDDHPPFDGWDGVGKPRARTKPTAKLERQRRAAEGALSGTARCPLRPGGVAPPAGWSYNASAYAPLVRRSLAPWYDGGLSATAIDLAYFREMYPYENRYERPSLHASLRRDGLRYRWQPNAPRPGEAAVRGGAHGEVPTGSADEALLGMLAQAGELVVLPKLELVAHTQPLPKVPAQNPEPVLAPATDRAHNDIPVPSPWLWKAARGGGGGGSGAGCTAPYEARRAQLLLQAECSGAADGYRGPLWRHYPPHRAALLAARPPLRGKLVVRLARPCVGPAVARLPLEASWDARASAELRAEAGVGAGAEDAVDPCAYRWELLLEGGGPPRGLMAALGRGSTVFLQSGAYVEFFSELLVPWVHFVPVSDNLADLADRVGWAEAHAARAAAIGAAGQLFASRIHAHEIACFWWQLLAAFAPLQDFEPRGAGDPRWLKWRPAR